MAKIPQLICFTSLVDLKKIKNKNSQTQRLFPRATAMQLKLKWFQIRGSMLGKHGTSERTTTPTLLCAPDKSPTLAREPTRPSSLQLLCIARRRAAPAVAITSLGGGGGGSGGGGREGGGHFGEASGAAAAAAGSLGVASPLFPTY